MPLDHASAQVRFIDEPVEPIFDTPPALLKKPGCPDGFVWRGHTFRVVELLAERFDFARRGAMARNMTPVHAATAAKRGSWGVGRYIFRVRCEERGTKTENRGAMSDVRSPMADRLSVRPRDPATGPQTRVFEIYYDRAPKPGGRTKEERGRRRVGSWVLWGEAVSD